MEGPPDLCVEVISPSSGKIDRDAKFKQYAKAGVEHYWMVDSQQRTIEGYHLVQRKYELTGKAKGDETIQLPPFKGLDIPLADLWTFRD